MDITIRFNYGRMVATFDNQDGLNQWINSYGSEIHQPFMYTIHGMGDVKCLEKYMKTL
jgi:hypothetical protein